MSVNVSSSGIRNFGLSRSGVLQEPKVSQIGSLRLLDRVHVTPASLNLSRNRSLSVKPLNAEPKKNDSMIPLAATMVAETAEEEVEVVEIEDFEKLAKKLENASPLEIMDQALAKYGNDIAIAFRCVYWILESVRRSQC